MCLRRNSMHYDATLRDGLPAILRLRGHERLSFMFPPAPHRLKNNLLLSGKIRFVSLPPSRERLATHDLIEGAGHERTWRPQQIARTRRHPARSVATDR